MFQEMTWRRLFVGLSSFMLLTACSARSNEGLSNEHYLAVGGAQNCAWIDPTVAFQLLQDLNQSCQKRKKPLLVYGFITMDDVELPHGQSYRNEVAGAALYAALGARVLSQPVLISAIGTDKAADVQNAMQASSLVTHGLQVYEGTTPRWGATYSSDLRSRTTTMFDIGVGPLFDQERVSRPMQNYAYFAPGYPAVQLGLIQKVRIDAASRAHTNTQSMGSLVTLDSLDYFVTNHRDDFIKAMNEADLVLLNEEEVALLLKTDAPMNMEASASQIFKESTARNLVIKAAEQGSFLFARDANGTAHPFHVNAAPAPSVIDPTGAGDSFGAALTSYLQWSGKSDQEAIVRAMHFGALVAKHTISSVGTKGLQNLDFTALYSELEACASH